MNELDALKKILFDIDKIDASRIQFIKEELNAGRYDIQSHHIASKLLEYVPITETLEIA